MQKIDVRRISEAEANEIFKGLLRGHSDEFLQRFFKDAFQCEIDRIALPEKERSYYIVSVDDRNEALFGINHKIDQVFNVSSMGRLINKDKTEGWQYLKAILELAIAQGVKRINAIVNDAGKRAFEKLKSNGALPKNWKIECYSCGLLTNVSLHGQE